ncbi:MAG: MFS transporter [Actinomycetaceae bacterium]|nr:MFS transporter [Actinomycetaceae bacterium]
MTAKDIAPRVRQRTGFAAFLILWSGGFISAIGSGLTSFGLGVYAYQTTGRASATAIVMLTAFLPNILLGAFAGVLADAHDRRLLMVAGDGLSAIGLVYILWCLRDGHAQIWQICLGVALSSVFASLLDPAFKATISDLLTSDQYTRASGMVQIMGSAKYLISPALAGFLLAAYDIRLLLIIDIATLAVTMTMTLVVRHSLMVANRNGHTEAGRGEDDSDKHQPDGDNTPPRLTRAFSDGWAVVTGNRGIFVLVWMAAVITFCLGVLETLLTPLVLAFTTASVLGTLETVAALGLLAPSIALGILPIRGRHTDILAASLFAAGACMVGFGIRESAVLIGATGFLVFAMMPFANACLDYLIRTNIPDQFQGRAWGLIGVLSQLGYVAAYASSGIITDHVFAPLLRDGGLLANSLGRLVGTGPGRGAALCVIVAGLSLCVAASAIFRAGSVRKLERVNH